MYVVLVKETKGHVRLVQIIECIHL